MNETMSSEGFTPSQASTLDLEALTVTVLYKGSPATPEPPISQVNPSHLLSQCSQTIPVQSVQLQHQAESKTMIQTVIHLQLKCTPAQAR